MEIAEPIQKIASIDTKHEAMIHDAQYDYYGKRLATCSSDGYIKVFDVTKRDNSVKLASFKAHNGPVWQISWAHPKYGNILASCGFDKKVCIWKETKSNEWALVNSHSEHQGSVNSLAWAPWEAGLKLAACSSDGCISILTRNSDDSWENPEKFQAHDLGVNSVAWAPLLNLDDLNSQSGDKNRPALKLASASCDNSIKIWIYDSVKKSYECIQKLTGNEADEQGHNDWVRDVAWCPALGNNYDLLASCSEDQKVILWKLYHDEPKIEKELLSTFEGPVWRVSWSLAGNMLAVSAANTNSETSVHVFQENEQGKWELLSQVANDKQ